MKKLPSPEEYGRKLAERRRKADRVPEIMRKLDTVATGLAENMQNLRALPFEALQKALAGIQNDLQAFDTLRSLQGLTDEDRRSIQAIENTQESILKALGVLEDTVSRLSIPVSESVDLKPLLQELRGYRAEMATPVLDVAESIQQAPTGQAYVFDKIVRDVDGNIAAGTRVVPVTRH